MSPAVLILYPDTVTANGRFILIFEQTTIVTDNLAPAKHFAFLINAVFRDRRNDSFNRLTLGWLNLPRG